MDSRNIMLQAIKNAKPALIPLQPFLPPPWLHAQEEIIQLFVNKLSAIGAVVTYWENETAIDLLQQKDSMGRTLVNAVKTSGSYNVQDYAKAKRKEQEKIGTVLVKGSIGVAENGAIWVTEAAMEHRLLPFVCEHLMIVIEAKNLVANMHEAYEHLGRFEEGYGVFIAGPSKTADIEQSLVIGAHGPLSLQVFIVQDSSSNATVPVLNK